MSPATSVSRTLSWTNSTIQENNSMLQKYGKGKKMMKTVKNSTTQAVLGTANTLSIFAWKKHQTHHDI